MYRGNEILGTSGDFGELGLIFFSNKLFLSSYVYFFKDWAKILSRLGSMSTLKSVQLKKAHVGCVTYPRLSFLPDGHGKAAKEVLKNIFSVGFPRSSTDNERYFIYYG